ncbi:MAG: exodeoxyribonuclease III [Nitrosomonas sp.]|nr:exodeoxyribonuclease III [Nitrosomonas sp.]
MKLSSWNVNSLKVRLPQVIDWLGLNQPDVLCLQETKLQDAQFPVDEIKQAGYHAIFSGQKTYNGVALLSKMAVGADPCTALPGLDDPQKRLIAATYDNVRVICIYVPNGERVDSEKYAYKLEWLKALICFLQEERKRYSKIALLGDFNIAPADSDVYDPPAWEEKVLCSMPEREAFQHLLAAGLVDSFRLFTQPPEIYTWWDYRMMGFRRNHGLRIDHILISTEMAAACTRCWVDVAPRKLERPSDHAPITVELSL